MNSLYYNFPLKLELDDIDIQYVENARRSEDTHSHPFFQVFFVVSGKLTHYIGGNSATISIGEMAIVPPDVKHHIELDDNPSFYVFSFNLSMLGKVNSLNEPTITFLRSLETKKGDFLPKTTLNEDEIIDVKNLFIKISHEKAKKEKGFVEAIKAYSILLITQFVRRYHKSSVAPLSAVHYTNEQMVLGCIRYIDQNFTKQLSLGKVSRMAAVSENTFLSCFKKLTGLTFGKYLNKRRIEYAIELIKKGYKLTSVSFLCGYTDYSTFVRNFKKEVGILPSVYAKTIS